MKKFNYKKTKNKLFKSHKNKIKIINETLKKDSDCEFYKACLYIYEGLEKLKKLDNTILYDLSFIDKISSINELDILIKTNIIKDIIFIIKNILLSFNRLNTNVNHNQIFVELIKKYKKNNFLINLNKTELNKIIYKLRDKACVRNITFKYIINKKRMRSNNEIRFYNYIIKKKYFDGILIGQTLPIGLKGSFSLDFLCIKKINNKIYRIAIEIDGEQHYLKNTFYNKTNSNLHIKRDNLKNKYFFYNNYLSFIRLKKQLDYSIYDQVFQNCFFTLKNNNNFYYLYNNSLI